MSRPPLFHRIAHQVQNGLNRLGDFWNRLVWPIEAAVGRIGETLFGAFDGFANFEALVVRAVGVLLWPFFALARLLGRWLPSGKEDGSPSLLMAGPVWLGGVLFRLAERLNLDGLLLMATRLLTPLWWPIATIAGGINAWLATRRPRELALAVPALVMAAPFAYVAAQASWQSRSAIETRYQIDAREAIEAGEYARAELLERKLAQLGIDTRRTAHRTALRLADEGDLAGAMERMASIAPTDTPGYPAAHVWIAQQLATAGDGEGATFPDIADPLTVAAAHLARLADLDVENAGIAQLRAYVCLKQGQNEAAIDALEPYAADTLNAADLRLRLLAEKGDRTQAKDQATELLRLLQREKRSGAIEARWCEAWLLAAQVVDDPAEVERAIGAWLKIEPDAERPRQLLSLLRRQQAERLAADATANPSRVVALVSEAIRLGASAAWVDQSLRRLSPGGAPSSRERRVWQLATATDTPATLLFAAATRAAAAGDIETAREGYARLVDRGAAPPETWNNYAWTLLQEPQPNPERALAAVGKALEQRQADYRFRETRGQALLALERWEEAISDLEYALNGMPESAEVHAALARCYDRLAKPQLADLHRRHAAR